MGRRVGHQQDDADNSRLPAVGFPRHDGDNPRLHVEDPKRLLKPRDLGLDLDYQERLAVTAPREHIDGPAFPKAIERLLAPHVPAGSGQQLNRPVLEQGVPPVEEPVEFGAAPPRRKRDVGVEGLGHPAIRVDRQRAEPAAFEVGNRLLRDAGADGDVSLPQTQFDPDRAEGVPDADPIHR